MRIQQAGGTARHQDDAVRTRRRRDDEIEPRSDRRRGDRAEGQRVRAARRGDLDRTSASGDGQDAHGLGATGAEGAIIESAACAVAGTTDGIQREGQRRRIVEGVSRGRSCARDDRAPGDRQRAGEAGAASERLRRSGCVQHKSSSAGRIRDGEGGGGINRTDIPTCTGCESRARDRLTYDEIGSTGNGQHIAGGVGGDENRAERAGDKPDGRRRIRSDCRNGCLTNGELAAADYLRYCGAKGNSCSTVGNGLTDDKS